MEPLADGSTQHRQPRLLVLDDPRRRCNHASVFRKGLPYRQATTTSRECEKALYCTPLQTPPIIGLVHLVHTVAKRYESIFAAVLLRSLSIRIGAPSRLPGMHACIIADNQRSSIISTATNLTEKKNIKLAATM